MRVLAVLAKTFAVIAGNRDDCLVDDAALAERVDDASDLRVGIGDFAIVGVAAGLRRELRRRLGTARAGRRGGPRERTATTAD